ncbi:hypothetical protein AB0D08_03700 [Kitasatospora sp. NPDC048540]|uniref:hypothetical protein n=1 Tax=unclassified Kitasatospora TaxID=2633591 RepID=UPI0005398F65|nr:hypothetical protein [Kitasatospora sp. MBT63]
MQISVRAAALRSAIEQATGELAHAHPTATGLRITASVPTDCGPERWADILKAITVAERWGATDAAGLTQIWAEIQEDP